MNSDKLDAMYLKIVVKNVKDDTPDIVLRTVHMVFPAMCLTSSGKKNDDTVFNYREETSSLNRHTGESFVLRNDIYNALGTLIEALRNSVTVVSCRMIYTTKAGIRVKIEATL